MIFVFVRQILKLRVKFWSKGLILLLKATIKTQICICMLMYDIGR